MKCVNCDNKKSLKRTSEVIRYTECGLDNVVLHGVDYRKCDKCGMEYVGYGDQAQLHELIAKVLVDKKSLLTGKEVRFLRKYLGFSTEMFSQKIPYTVETISRLENSKKPMSATYDFIIRLMVRELLPDRDYDLHDWLLEENRKNVEEIDVEASRGHWKLAA